MDATEDVLGYLLLALQSTDKLYSDSELNPDPENPSENIAEIETLINNALSKLDGLKVIKALHDLNKENN